jgi:hypothetical protein
MARPRGRGARSGIAPGRAGGRPDRNRQLGDAGAAA